MDQEYRISKLGGGIAISIAFFIDLVQMGLALLVIGGVLNTFVISPIVYLSFWTWLKLKGVKFLDKKNATTVISGAIIEAIPFINALPGLTVSITRIILNTRLEDMAKKHPVVAKKAKIVDANQPAKQSPSDTLDLREAA